MSRKELQELHLSVPGPCAPFWLPSYGKFMISRPVFELSVNVALEATVMCDMGICCEYASTVAHVTVPSLKCVSKLKLPHHLNNNNNNNGRDERVRIFAFTLNRIRLASSGEA
jgi:hypothetical protein